MQATVSSLNGFPSKVTAMALLSGVANFTFGNQLHKGKNQCWPEFGVFSNKFGPNLVFFFPKISEHILCFFL